MLMESHDDKGYNVLDVGLYKTMRGISLNIFVALSMTSKLQSIDLALVSL